MSDITEKIYLCKKSKEIFTYDETVSWNEPDGMLWLHKWKSLTDHDIWRLSWTNTDEPELPEGLIVASRLAQILWSDK